MHFFQSIGMAILERWRRADFDARAFPQIATDVLLEQPPSAHVDPMDVVRWVHQTPALVPQADVDSVFGQPPVTVFRCEPFYIDVLFWVDGTTTIHQHKFSGAFHVMEGSSIQSAYEFTPRRRYCEHLLAGDLALTSVELLSKGDVRSIEAGAGLVHSLFHLDRPSVSVVVRTPSDAVAGPQYSYSRAGLAFDPFAKSPSATRKIQTLDLLHKTNHMEFEGLARSTVQAADSFLAFQVLLHLLNRIEPRKRYFRFLESIRPNHHELIELLKAHAEEDWRDQYINSRRQLAKEPEHRFFLGVLRAVPDRARILELVERAYPGRPPASVIVQWLAELSKLDAMHAWVGLEAAAHERREERQVEKVLDVVVDALRLELLGLLLAGLSNDEAVARVRSAGNGESGAGPGDLMAACDGLRESVLLRPLLVG